MINFLVIAFSVALAFYLLKRQGIIGTKKNDNENKK